MSLTKDDLQAIKGLIHDEVHDAVAPMLEPINTRLGSLEEGQKKLEAKVDKLDAKVDKLDARVDKLDARADKLESRMDRLEEIVQSVHESQLIAENVWYPKISLALEGLSLNEVKNRERDRRIDALEDLAENHGSRILVLESASAKS